MELYAVFFSEIVRVMKMDKRIKWYEDETCPFEIYTEEIGESRCVIPVLPPENVIGRAICKETWYCVYRDKYEECPVLQRLGMKVRDMILPTFCTLCGSDAVELKPLECHPAPIGDAYKWRIKCTCCKAEVKLELMKSDPRMGKVLR